MKDKSGWSFPKGSTEVGETFLRTAQREGSEETGFKIDADEVAFVTEFTLEKYVQIQRKKLKELVIEWCEEKGLRVDTWG